MKSLLEYKKELIKVKEPGKEIEESFNNLNNLFNSWKININDIKIPSLDYNPNDDEFDLVFIKEYIKKALQIPERDPLWDNIFTIKKDKEITCYGKEIINIRMEVIPRIDKLKEVPGIWVYNNYNSVDFFMKKDNEIYSRLLEIKKIFSFSYSNGI